MHPIKATPECRELTVQRVAKLVQGRNVSEQRSHILSPFDTNGSDGHHNTHVGIRDVVEGAPRIPVLKPSKRARRIETLLLMRRRIQQEGT